MPTLDQLFRRKPVPEMSAESGSDSNQSELERSIGLFQLSAFGIGATIGTGIFFVLSEAVPIAGPAVIWSFVLAGAVAGLTAVCYAELASAVPVSGSSYSYAYATLGELPAIGVAACLLLEYGVSAGAVAVGWSQYLNQFLDNVFSYQLPSQWTMAPEEGGCDPSWLPCSDAYINLPAVILIILVALLLIRGASESATVNAVMVCIKLGVLVMFIVIGVTGWNSDNLSPFAPDGLNGVTTAAGIIFFSYIGLDAVSTAGEEVKNPRRNLPLAILIALVTVTTLYLLVSLIAVAAQPAAEFEGQSAGLSQILEDITGSEWPGTVIAAGAIISIFSVTLIVIYGQTRILFAMARDGMLPELFHRVNPRTLTPVPNTVIVAAVIAVLAGLIPINFLAEMTSIGTLVAFLVVSIGVMVLRQTHPELPRGFKVPLYPVTPILSIAGCIWIIQDLRAVTIWVFLIWVTVALLWYAVYGFKHSHLGRHEHVGLIHDEETPS
ncbi:amino acid permease [Nocardioides guangzhouensis]|uniref:Amino acid permease n=1 Tax=Nocardioides guangzhouensis TaxID=2497878 RepID=A0A4Q4ZFS9_9ACTN|nr:amino acid permease [Nocardioides guangzhouensis]RYP87002.1 amino acid permease [Nocardioides guangzhouensis]